MTKVFIRTMYPYTTGVSVPPSGIRLMSSYDQWSKFERLLMTCLSELGHEVTEQRQPPTINDDFNGAAFRIYAHKTRRDVEGELFYKQMHLSDLFTIDTQGWGADHSQMQVPPRLLTINPTEAEQSVLALRSKFLETGGSKMAQPGRNESISLPDDYIFVPTQTPRDYVQVHHAPISVLSFIRLIAEWANESKQNVVFKLHPGLFPRCAADNDLINAMKEYVAASRYVFCSQANVHDLIANAKGIFTINSGVGFESLIHGKPVVTFGNCDYQWVTFRANPDCLNAAREFVFEYTNELRQEAYKFVYYYLFHHAFNLEAEYVPDSQRRLSNYLAGCLRDRDH